MNELDRDLIERLKKSDHSAYELLCEKFDTMIWHAAYLIINDPDTVEDIVSETKIQIWNYRNSLHEDSIRNYIFTIARNKALDFKKSGKRRLNLERILSDMRQEIVVNDELERKELGDRIKMEIKNIASATCRQAFEMFYLDEKNNREIAKEMKIQKQVVKNLLSEGRKILREALKDLR